jgi:ribosome-binding protein aMBF1 (putative translation factor)
MKCPNCSEKMTPQGYRHITKIGGFTVTDETGGAPTCGRCGEVVLSSKQLAGYERRAAFEILTAAEKPVSGAVLKYARKALGLRQKDLAPLIGSDEFQLSRWENADAIDKQLRLAMAALLNIAERGDAGGVGQVGATPGHKLEIRKAS